PRQVASRRWRIKKLLPGARIRWTCVDLVRSLHLGRCQTRGTVGGPALQHSRIEFAGLRILDKTILDSVKPVACLQYSVVENRQFVRRKEAGLLLLVGVPDPHLLQGVARLLGEPRYGDTVVIARVTLDFTLSHLRASAAAVE